MHLKVVCYAGTGDVKVSRLRVVESTVKSEFPIGLTNVSKGKYEGGGLDVRLPTHDFGRLHRVHLLSPASSWHDPADGADFV